MTEKINDYKDLIVWQKAVSLVQEVYLLTQKIPKEELYGITNQIRRSVVSIPSNIAEGRYRKTKKDFSQFLHIAYGSTAELETRLILLEKLYKISSPTCNELIIKIRKMLAVFIKKISL